MDSVKACASGSEIDGKYRIARLLGEGGMGAVYEARHTGTGRRVAVKVIAKDSLAANPEALTRFQREARASGAIESQHIAQVLDTGIDPASGRPYLVMEYLVGEDVHQLIRRVGPLPPDVALRITAQACIGLARAHEAGVVHRDIKPANLFLARREDAEVVVKLLDFGIAKVKMDQFSTSEQQSLTRSGALLGSPLYMSPEQAKGAKTIDQRTDIWSLGVVLYEALSGVTPHGHLDTLGGLILAICSEPPRLVQELAAWIPPEVANIVHTALALDENARYQSARAMLDAIRALLPQGSSLTEPMLVGASEEARSVAAPRLIVTEGKLRPPPPSGPIVSPLAASATDKPASTTSGLAQSRTETRKSPRALAIGVAATVVLGGGLLAYRAVLHRAPSVALSAPATSSAAIATPSTVPPPSASASNVVAERSVNVMITPATAAVEIDGNASAVKNGFVIVAGALGSKHNVHVMAAGKETTVVVVISEDGAVPDRIELGAPRPVKASGAPGPGPNAVPGFNRKME
jgi:eukaryotic-like serine/threonine-protein kinase